MDESDRCPATNRNGERCGHPQGWGTDTTTGPCKFHGGEAGAPEKNQNAATHHLHSTPEYLLEDVSDRHRDTYYALHEALCTRYERRHGIEPDYAARKRLSRVAVEMVKEDLADEYLRQQAHEGNPLIEEQEELTEAGPWQSEEVNKVLPILTQLKRETRLTLKDMGLLKDPDTQQADATRSLAQLLSEHE